MAKFGKHDIGLPWGVADYLPGQAFALKAIEDRVMAVASLWGYQRILPASLEFEELLTTTISEGEKSRSFRFDDWQSGRLLAIPSDITPQIGRIAATRLKGWPLPHRLCYAGKVLRHTEQQSGRSREILQAGVELIGLDSHEADAEMVSMAVEIMEGLGISGWKIDLGQVEFSRGVLAASGLHGEQLAALRTAVGYKDISLVEDIARRASVSDSARREIIALPRLFGGTGVMDEAEALIENPRSRAALENLRKVIQLLEMNGVAENLTIDLGESRGLDYHTGLTFQGFVPGAGDALFSGGRYDTLLSEYGLEAPATGFACNLVSLLKTVERQSGATSEPAPRDFLIFNSLEDRGEALALARSLRRMGYSAARDIIRRDLDSSVDYAARTGIKNLLVLGCERCGADHYQLVRVRDRAFFMVEKFRLQQDEFLAGIDKMQENING